MVVTAYSEFFVKARRDLEFKKVLNAANLVLPDGVGPLAANYYHDSQNWWLTGLKVLKGEIGETVPGVWLFSELVKEAALKDWKVLLLGGFGDTAEILSKQLKSKYSDLKIMADPGEQNLALSSGSEETLLKISNFQPDLLFVAYGPGRQEKWIAKFKKDLSCKVAIGVGGTFDELSGKVKPAPEIWEKAGLKWLWRLIQEPKRIGRIFNAVIIFPLLVFWDTMKE